MSTQKQKSKIWTTPGLAEKVIELIDAGFLKKGIDVLLKEVNQTVFKGSDKIFLRKSHLYQKLYELIWSERRMKLIRRFVSLDAPLDLLYKELDVLPRNIIDKKAKELHGLSVKKKISDAAIGTGVGRLVTNREISGKKPIALQSYRLDNPFPVKVRDDKNFNLLFINGAHLGLEYNRVIDENVLRNMFRDAERDGNDAIFLTGALLWLDAKKSTGFLTTHRALYSGLDFDPSVLPDAYRKEALEIRKKNPPDKVSFVKLRERMLNAMGGWSKITRQKDGKPIFSGKVYISFGLQEEEIIEAAAHFEVLRITTVMRNEVMIEKEIKIAVLKSRLSVSGGVENEGTKKLRTEINELLDKEKRMIQSNVDTEDRKRFVDSIRSILIEWFKRAIPNSEFLSQGSVVCKVGDKTIEIIQSPENSPVSNSLDGYMKVGGQRALDNKLPDFAVVAAPYNVDARMGVIEKMNGAERAVTHAWQLPVAIDREYIRGARPEMIKKGSPIERLVRDPNFEPGAFRLRCVGGVWTTEVVPIPFYRVHRSRSITSHNISEYIYGIVDSDNHAGLRSKEWVYDAKTGLPIPLEVAFSELLTRNFTDAGKMMPIHFYVNLADNLQGHHFPTQQTIHHLSKSYSQEESEVKKMLQNAKRTTDPEKLREMIQSYGLEHLSQSRFRGEDWMTNQFSEYLDTSLLPRTRLFSEILKSSAKAGLRIKGIEEARYGSGYDSRDIGVISWVSGDHVSHTTEEELAEGVMYQRLLIGYLLADRSLGMNEETLRRLVRAPRWGNFSVGYGLLSVPGGYEWGMAVRHKPTASSGKNGDRMQGMTENLGERGDYSRIFSGRSWFQLSGHMHFYGASFSRNKFMLACASSTDGDAFGDMLGFRKNNAGGMVVGIPAKGPEYGPVRVIPFPNSFLREYFKSPWKIDWSSVFRDPYSLQAA
ncbi:MAG: hypothetical protein WCW78_03740 [Candidatus Paceibacterota bacterium]|jgi:hypothetical protein